MSKENLKEKTSFWGKPIKDEKGNVLAYRDEFGDVRTKKEIVGEGSGCLLVGLSVLALLGCVFARGCQEIKKRIEKNDKKAAIEKVDPVRLNLQKTNAGK